MHNTIADQIGNGDKNGRRIELLLSLFTDS